MGIIQKIDGRGGMYPAPIRMRLIFLFLYIRIFKDLIRFIFLFFPRSFRLCCSACRPCILFPSVVEFFFPFSLLLSRLVRTI